MMTDKPLKEVAEIIFNMDSDRVKRAEIAQRNGGVPHSVAERRKRIEDKKHEQLVNQIEKDEFWYEGSFLDNTYFNSNRI
ncbi:hypothetical protein [Vibrio phage vB_VhaP_PG11]|nr:hypothetical protein [Vibrio phage vB_VhaP_PG11]